MALAMGRGWFVSGHSLLSVTYKVCGPQVGQSSYFYTTIWTLPSIVVKNGHVLWWDWTMCSNTFKHSRFDLSTLLGGHMWLLKEKESLHCGPFLTFASQIWWFAFFTIANWMKGFPIWSHGQIVCGAGGGCNRATYLQAVCGHTNWRFERKKRFVTLQKSVRWLW